MEPGQPESFDYEPGRGPSAHVDGSLVEVGNAALVTNAPTGGRTTPELVTSTTVHAAVDGQYLGSIGLADSVRLSARRCVDDLHSIGVCVLMLTGDSHATAAAVAAQLGIDDVRAELLPGDKLTAIDAERAAGHAVAMVGDGGAAIIHVGSESAFILNSARLVPDRR